MKFEVGQVWRTRDGRKARIICTDRLDDTHEGPVVALLTLFGDKHESVFYFRKDGTKCDHSSYKNEIDLIEPWTEPMELKYYMVVCRKNHLAGKINWNVGQVLSGLSKDIDLAHTYRNFTSEPENWQVVELKGFLDVLPDINGSGSASEAGK